MAEGGSNEQKPRPRPKTEEFVHHNPCWVRTGLTKKKQNEQTNLFLIEKSACGKGGRRGGGWSGEGMVVRLQAVDEKSGDGWTKSSGGLKKINGLMEIQATNSKSGGFSPTPNPHQIHTKSTPPNFVYGGPKTSKT